MAHICHPSKQGGESGSQIRGQPGTVSKNWRGWGTERLIKRLERKRLVNSTVKEEADRECRPVERKMTRRVCPLVPYAARIRKWRPKQSSISGVGFRAADQGCWGEMEDRHSEVPVPGWPRRTGSVSEAAKPFQIRKQTTTRGHQSPSDPFLMAHHGGRQVTAFTVQWLCEVYESESAA